jgi:hypothetical protein
MQAEPTAASAVGVCIAATKRGSLMHCFICYSNLTECRRCSIGQWCPSCRVCNSCSQEKRIDTWCDQIVTELLHKFGYRVRGQGLPDHVQIHGRKYSVSCPWDYFTNARAVCKALTQPAYVINSKGAIVYTNVAARK